MAFAVVSFSGCSAPSGSDSSDIVSQPGCLTSVPRAVSLPGGQAVVGSDTAYPEERPSRSVTIPAFEIDAAEVTYEQFATFIEATGYVTDAEKPQPGFGVPGAAVFKDPDTNEGAWWSFVEGANWRQPEGPQPMHRPRANDPVVQVSLNDARAYATWIGRRLPTEIEWEYAAKAGSETLYVWGNKLRQNDREHANTWQGAFPIQNTEADGYVSRSPIGCFQPNNFGLYDMIGNVWEWTDSEWGRPGFHVVKGGSFLCAENFCRRYRASARQAQEIDFSTNHIGFRTVK